MARLVMKVTRRTANNVWDFPLTVRDYNQNLRLRREAETLEASRLAA
jgi:hypothetical protein